MAGDPESGDRGDDNGATGGDVSRTGGGDGNEVMRAYGSNVVAAVDGGRGAGRRGGVLSPLSSLTISDIGCPDVVAEDCGVRVRRGPRELSPELSHRRSPRVAGRLPAGF